MSEIGKNKGEFKRRLEFCTTLASRGELWVHKPEIEKIVDEAKNEITTTLEAINKNCVLLEAETNEEKILRLSILAKTVIDTYGSWLKKWFGGTTKEAVS